MEGDGTEATVVVTRFINVWPRQNCERSRADAALLNTYWRLVRLGDEATGAASGNREPHLILRGPVNRYTATVGCNSMTGGYELNGQSLRLSAGPTTLMACPPPLDAMEISLIGTLDRTRRYRIVAQTLELFDAEGASLALLEAVYLQ
jgi:heat shock protein HslJ